MLLYAFEHIKHASFLVLSVGLVLVIYGKDNCP